MKALITNAAMALLDDQITTAAEKGVTDRFYGLIPSGYLFIENGVISAFGPMSALQADLANNTAMNQIDDAIDAAGRLLTPALIDCHTHVVYGGHRALEFEMRLKGASYAEVAKAGGGIVSTVSATRSQSVEQLVEGALRHDQHFRRHRMLGQRIEFRDLEMAGRFEARPVVLGAVDDAGLQAGIDLAERHRRGIGAERRDQRGREAEEPHARAAGGGWRVRELHAQGARRVVRAKCIRMRLALHRFARQRLLWRACRYHSRRCRELILQRGATHGDRLRPRPALASRQPQFHVQERRAEWRTLRPHPQQHSLR